MKSEDEISRVKVPPLGSDKMGTWMQLYSIMVPVTSASCAETSSPSLKVPSRAVLKSG